MKKIRFSLTINFVLIVFVLLGNSCSKDKPRTIDPEFSRYIAAFTYGAISSDSEIQIELTQDLPAVELDKEIEEELFEFSPSIKGKAFWTSSRKIKFIPEPGELKSGQEYHVWFKLDEIMKVEGKFKEFYFFFNVPKQNFSIDVLPYSPTKDNDLTWNSVQGALLLADNAPIDKVQQMLSVSGETTAKIKVTQTEQTGRYTFTIDSLKRYENRPTDYVLRVNGSPIDVEKEEKSVITLPKLNLNPFLVVDARVVYDPQECIRVTFSDPLSSNQNIQGLITPNGIENFSYDIQKNVLKLYLDPDNKATSVDLVIQKELRNFDNKLLDRRYTYELSLEKNKPQFELINSGNILPNSENLVLPFKAVNLWAVDVKIVKIFENNVLGYLQSNEFGGDSDLRRFGRLILKKRIRLDSDHTLRLDQWNIFSIDLATLIKQDPGSIYRVELSMKQAYSLYPCNGVVPQVPQDASLERFDDALTEEEEAKWDVPSSYYYEWDDYDWEDRDNPCTPSYYANKKSGCIVFASNMGIIAKLGSDKKILVSVNDIQTTEPVSGAEVDVYNYQMQRIGSSKTDGDGFVSIDYKGGVPFAIITGKDKEKGYLKVTSNLSLSLSNFDVSGKEIQKGLKGYLYGERGVWRPGDTLFLTFILEDKDKSLPKDHPVSLEMFTPMGQLYQKYVTTNGQDGFYTFKVVTDPNAQTGNWQAVVKVGGVSFSQRIKIETVKPNRLKIRLDAGTTIDASRGLFTGSLSSQWLHGAPASNLKAKVEMTLSATSKPFKGYEQYSFSNPATNFYSDTYTLFDGRLDGNGNATVTGKLPQASTAPGMLKANFVSRVFESGGDASIYSQTAPYSPFSSYVGIKTPNTSDYEMLETDVDNVIDIVTLTADGKLTNRSQVNVKVYKIRWSWWWSSSYDDLASYVNSTYADIILNQDVSTTGGKTKVKLKVNYPDWGRYLVLAEDEQSGHIAGKVIYIDWPSWRGRSNKQDADGLTMLSFSTEKQSYKVGEKARVILPKSSAGRALISIENGSKVISREWVETSATEDTKHSFTVTEEMTPNFYIFATLLQPHGQTDNDLPIRMYGVVNVSVTNDNSVLNPVITMPDELRPEKEFTVSVSEKNRKKMTYTLAIVDEGLLDLTAFKTPDAWADFYAKQALGVRSWDMYDMVVGASAGKIGPLLSIGGDGELKSASNQMNRFKPVVEFLGPFSLKGGDTRKHNIKLPSYIGSVRVMVVAGSSEGAYGNTEKTVPVKNPLMILSTLPRVAGPGEDILLPVNVFAMDKKLKNVTVTVKTSSGLLQLTDGATKSVTFTETGDKMVYFRLKAATRTGAEEIEIRATGNGEVSTEAIDIEVRNPNPAVLMTSQALISSGQSQELAISMDAPQAGDWVKLEISRMPGVDLSKNLAYLLEYPHGCSEQVTSRAFPALYVGTFTKFSDQQTEKMKWNINEAIKIISARQLGDGGIAYWPGNRYPTEWVTTYAGHFLLEAQKHGYKVPEPVISKWKKFQKKTAQSWNKGDIYNSYYSYSMSDLQQAYRLYTLALAGDAELGAMNRLKEMRDISVQARWRLAAAYAVAGKKDAASQLISGASDNVDTYAVSNNTYGDSDRDLAMIMETYLLLGKTDKALQLARKVSKALNSDYISTQSASFGLIAMSKLADKIGSGVVAYEWELNGVKQANGNSGKALEEIAIKPQENIRINFTNNGQGELYVRLVGRSKPLVDTTPEVNNGLNLFVKYTDPDDKEIDVTSLRQGTEFYASVIVQNISGEYLTDVALSQLFASGWEIFNNRLFGNESATLPYTYQDIRDDRVLSYFNLQNGYSTAFKVRLQAAYCGRFYLPAVVCETMYRPEEQSKTKGQWVEVIQ
ncbi:alpha-2-macroglobulin family protein [Viscerimonas tarda]